jgi:hypothetical protein
MDFSTRPLLALALALVCLTPLASAQYAELGQQQPQQFGQQKPFAAQQRPGQQQPLLLMQAQQPGQEQEQHPLLLMQAQQPGQEQEQQPMSTMMEIEFPEEIQAVMKSNHLPNDAYSWTEEQTGAMLIAEELRIGNRIPGFAKLMKKCRDRKKCKCRAAGIPASSAYHAAVAQMREYAKVVALHNQVNQLQSELVSEERSTVQVSSDKNKGFELLFAALGVCLCISVAFNYVALKAGPGGRDANMRSEVKATIASMTRA